MPEFQSEGIKRLNSKIDIVVKNVQFALCELEKISFANNEKNSYADYENQYLRTIINRLKYVYLFGVTNLDRVLKKYRLSIAYVSLELAQREEICGLRELLENNHNLWISGEAGAGKTTLLQWIAVQYAKEYSIRATLPVYIELRDFQDEKLNLNTCIDNIMKDSSYKMPSGWLEDRITNGKAVFLIDGFDEISQIDRDHVFNWLEEIDSNNKCKKVYTSRPQITQRPLDQALLDVTILPMKNKTIKLFLSYWHKAVLEDQLQLSSAESEKTVKKLYTKIVNSPSLLKLASSPLLCAMLCALHYKNEMNLPINKRELYEECCKLLIENRDIERGLKIRINLSYEQKKAVLSQLAYWMMLNNYSEISKKVANEKVKEFSSSMIFTGQGNINVESVFSYLLERSGILREPEKNRIDFIHRSFEEYLAATEISRQENWGFLMTVAADDMWKETVEIAIGFANIEKASTIINSVLNKSIGRKGNQKYLFLACSYYNNALQVDYKTSQAVKNHLRKLIPPKDTDVDKLAKIGDLVIDFLTIKANEVPLSHDFVNYVRVLRHIGTIKALEMANTYLVYDMPIEALKEYGMMLNDFTSKELLDCDVPKLLETYVYTYFPMHKTLHEGMISALLLLSDEVMEDIERIIGKKLTIIGYTGNVDLSRLFRKSLIETLSLYGTFSSINQSYLFTQVRHLTICSTNEHFAVNNLINKGCFNAINELVLITYSIESINLDAFLGCNFMTLINLNRNITSETVCKISSVPYEVAIGGSYLNKISNCFAGERKTKLLLNNPQISDLRNLIIKKGYESIEFISLNDALTFYLHNSGNSFRVPSYKYSISNIEEIVAYLLHVSTKEVSNCFFTFLYHNRNGENIFYVGGKKENEF